jgi:2-oxo-4-hydroxy-4-carboxy--5-ureidoimidazoline (OHCU) decarboxylase
VADAVRPTIAELDALPADGCAAALAALFEGAPRFLERLCAERPFGDAAALFVAARRIAATMPEDERIELVDAHPRLGAPPRTVSAASFVEQGYDRDAASAAPATPAPAVDDDERTRIAAELDRLNDAYEARFGFRYCVFVAGRSRTELLPELAAALAADRDAELARAIDAVIDIAADRWARSGG